jgi:hypothetical protein
MPAVLPQTSRLPEHCSYLFKFLSYEHSCRRLVIDISMVHRRICEIQNERDFMISREIQEEHHVYC